MILTAPTVRPLHARFSGPEHLLMIATDGNQWNRDGEVTGDPSVKRELTHDTRAQRHYMTRRGQNIFVPDGAKVGDIVWTPKSVL